LEVAYRIETGMVLNTCVQFWVGPDRQAVKSASRSQKKKKKQSAMSYTRLCVWIPKGGHGRWMISLGILRDLNFYYGIMISDIML
jgi:hypothetical protein